MAVEEAISTWLNRGEGGGAGCSGMSDGHLLWTSYFVLRRALGVRGHVIVSRCELRYSAATQGMCRFL